MKTQTLIILLAALFPISLLADCYLGVQAEADLSPSLVSQIASIELTRYVEPVSETPVAGIPENACVYRINLSKLDTGILLVIKGRELTSYAESNRSGLEGFRQALFRAIIREKPSKKAEICKKNASLLPVECGQTAASGTTGDTGLVVNDASTGLTWQRQVTEKKNWENAKTHCQELNLAGIDNWRLPNKQEIQSSYRIQHRFPNLESYYWSSTPDAENRYYAWGFTTADGSVFSDWIENKYHVRCVSGEPLAMPAEPPAEKEAAQEQPVTTEIEADTGSDPLGMRWVVGPTYISGYSSIVDLYIHNLEEQGYSVEEEESGYPIGVSFRPYQQMQSGFRLGAGFGPLMGVYVRTGNETTSFYALPVDVNAGYTLQNGIFFRGGLSFALATGDFIVSQNPGVAGAAGMEFMRRKRVSLGFEVGFDVSSVTFDKYDCSESATPGDLDTCDSEEVTLMPVGLMASFLVIF